MTEESIFDKLRENITNVLLVVRAGLPPQVTEITDKEIKFSEGFRVNVLPNACNCYYKNQSLHCERK